LKVTVSRRERMVMSDCLSQTVPRQRHNCASIHSALFQPD
jgi:hypothetical protein